MKSSKKKVVSRMLILIPAITLIAICGIAHIFFTDKSEFKSPDGKITATFSNLDRTLTFSGEGEISGIYYWIKGNPNYCNKTPGAAKLESVRKIIFEPGITSIGVFEFGPNIYCRNLRKVVFKGDIDRIGSYNFYGCPELTEVIFEGNCKSIGFWAFGCCNEDLKANVPEGCQAERHSFLYPYNWIEMPELYGTEQEQLRQEYEERHIP